MVPGELGPVVAGFNGTPGSRLAVRWAAREAALRGRTLRLVHAFSAPLAELTRVHLPGETLDLDTLRRQAEEDLQAAANESVQTWPALAVETTVQTGSPATVLQAAAEQGHMLVLGPARHGWPHRVLLGSTTAELMRTVRVPVILVGSEPAADAAAGHVVVGADGSPSSARAVGFAFDFAARHEVELLAVLAWDELPSDAMPPTGVWKWLDWGDVFGACERELAESLAGWQEQYPDVVLHTQVTTAELPTAFLLRLSTAADFVIVGRHGRAALRHALVGSTSEALAHYASCPVAIVQ